MVKETVPSSRPLRVFLSSTARDLPEHRTAVAEIIDRLGHAPVRMETFGARSDSSLIECQRLAAEADAMVVVVAHRYGWVPTPEDGGDGEKSITWFEVEAAIRAAKPVFRYLIADATASSDPRDDDIRLELFRQFLRRYPCDTFSTPDDLAGKVAVTLGDWSRLRARDFASALQMIDLTRYEAQPETLRASSFFQVTLTRLVLDGSVVSIAALDQVVEGSSLRAAKEALAQHLGLCAQQWASLNGQLSSARADELEIRGLVERLMVEPPPSTPRPPQPPVHFGPGWNAAQEMQDERYRREQEEYRQAIEHHKLALTAYDERRATIPGERLRLQTAQQYVSQLASDLNRLTNDCASQQRRLEAEIGIGRDQDLSALLAAMRDRGVQDLTAPETLSQGFFLLLATGLSVPFLSRYLSDHAAAALWVEQVGRDVAEVAEETVLREHQRIGMDCLALLDPLERGLERGLERTSEIRGILDALPLDEVRAFSPEAQSLLAFRLPTIEINTSLVDPSSIALAATGVDRQQLTIGQTIGAIEALFDKSAALRASAQEAATHVAALLERMEENATGDQPWLEDCKLTWGLVSHAQQRQGFERETREFCGCLRGEAERRLREPVEQLVARCESRRFGVRDAEAVRAEHEATGFLQQSEALEKHRGELKAQAAQLVRDGETIAKLPWRQAKAYRKRLRLFTVLSAVPVLNVLCAVSARALLRRYGSAMRSDHPAYQGLGRWSLPWMLGAAGLSVGGILFSHFAPSFFPAETDERVVPLLIVGLLYGIGLVLWLLQGMRVLAVVRGRQQNTLEAGDAASSPGDPGIRNDQRSKTDTG